MPPFPWQLVTVDIDGTLTRRHGWEPIARAFGREPAFLESNRRFSTHEIDEDEHLRDLLDLATGRTVAEVERVVAATPRLAGIAEGLAALHRDGARVALLTHNPSYVVEYYRRTFGFDDAEGVDAQSIVDGRIGPPTSVRADKLEGLGRLLQRAGTPAQRTVHVGDSWADVPVFRAVGGGVALNSALPDVRAAADLALATDDFRAVVTALDGMRPRDDP